MTVLLRGHETNGAGAGCVDQVTRQISFQSKQDEEVRVVWLLRRVKMCVQEPTTEP